DIHLLICEPLSVVDSPMFEFIGDKAIVTSEFISVNETLLFYFLDRQFQESLTLDIGQISTVTFSPCSRMPNSGTFPAAPHPCFPFLLPPKYDSSISISPEKEDAFALVARIALLMREWILYTVL
ncbi:MAG: hypothetical protein QMC82_01935, partial [Methanolinea sp.]|nr:hypothetical protein [Methanolinea sp.]